jgi:FKBP-type peptidyl-prolyl cis-trans isomerase FklB
MLFIMYKRQLILKFTIVTVFMILLITNLSRAADLPQETGQQSGEKDRISYSLGFQIGSDFKEQSQDIDPTALVKGIEDGLATVEPQISREEMRATLVEMKKKILARKKEELAAREADQLKTKEKYRGEGREFLAANAKKEGVITLSSGLQYKILRPGAGRTPGPQDSVKVHYRGTLIDGTEFGSSYQSEGKPETLHVNGVIKGMAEALQLMKEGAKWQLFIPADLAYGERGPLADRAIIYELELIAVEPSS